MQPDVSIIIAAYNAEDTVARAVRTALKQDGVQIEVIVVDDASVDDTPDIVSRIDDDRVHLIRLAENGGPGAARNAGLEAASGRYIAVLDSDDTMHPDRMARLVACADREQADIVVDNIEIVGDAAPQGELMFPPDELSRRDRLDLAAFIAGNRMFDRGYSLGYMKPMLRRDFVEMHGLRYDTSLRIGEDYILIASALANGALCVVDPRPGYVYHIREGSISRVLEQRHVHAMLSADEAFVASHHLDDRAREAQARRTRSLQEAASFLRLVDDIKALAPMRALRTALRDPRAVLHLKMPIMARVRRLLPRGRLLESR
ncbi:glycosyltransferase family 2 protein [Rhizobium sp. EC-SD404]|uniref:glycosyltransferase family 2 protein n=1 Tax=Rhizobium sp. EC-SD404 TaxID=2038389 RepID=UPI0012516296|nr:glycosyltransferase family 2 protein [Rhizobium sp. EC-SD404]VVT10125.1 Succinoglycan biosynthesis protein ExoO [Rhizobium sp. EC-SD404]